MSPRRTPAQVWREMVRGNERFVAGEPQHPRQDVERREQLAGAQAPHAALFGCSDSRLAAEIIFDKGLGDLFVVRNAGQVISDSVIGSLEYAVAVLDVPLIVVLGHDECGAVSAAIDSLGPDATPAAAAHRQPDRADRAGRAARAGRRRATGRDRGRPRAPARHRRRAASQRSELISDAVAAGTLAVVGANYRLLEGKVVPDVVLGDTGAN